MTKAERHITSHDMPSVSDSEEGLCLMSWSDGGGTLVSIHLTLAEVRQLRKMLKRGIKFVEAKND